MEYITKESSKQLTIGFVCCYLCSVVCGSNTSMYMS